MDYRASQYRGLRRWLYRLRVLHVWLSRRIHGHGHIAAKVADRFERDMRR